MANTIERIAGLKAQIKELETEVENLYSSLPESSVPGKHREGNFVLTVSPRKEFSAKLASENLSQAKYNKILVSKPDSKLAQKVLTGEEYESLRVEVGVTRRITEVGEE